MIIIARTHMEEKDHVIDVIRQYSHRSGYLAGLDIDKCLEVGLSLWQTGKVIEPRSNGIYAVSVPSEYIWMDLYPTVPNVASPAVKEAWDAYRMLISLTEQLPEGGNDAPVKHGYRVSLNNEAVQPAPKFTDDF